MKKFFVVFLATLLLLVSGCPETDDPPTIYTVTHVYDWGTGQGPVDPTDPGTNPGGPVVIPGDKPGDQMARPNPTQWPNPVKQDPINPSDPSTRTLKYTTRDYNADGSLKPASSRTRIKHEVWIGLDTNADPRNAVGYKLVNSGKQLFDRVVLFHATLAWDHLDPSSPGGIPPLEKRNWCTRNDIHLHLHDRIQWLLADWNKFIKPLKDAGMEVVLCILPSGQGLCYSSIGDWPGGNSQWNNDTKSGGVYGKWEDICGVAGAKRFAKELADFCAQYDIDGIVLDDEYCNAPAGYGLRSSAHTESSAGAQNVFRWLRYFKDITTTRLANGEPDPNGKWPNGKIVSVYGHKVGAAIPLSLALESVYYNGSTPVSIPSKTYNIKDVVDGCSPGQYGPITASGGNSSVPNAQKALWATAFDGAGSSVSPDGYTLPNHAAQALNGGYGMVMYFALRERSWYNINKYFSIKMGSQLEDWATYMTEVMYKDGVWYDGPDHPKFPMQRGAGIWTTGTGALYRPRNQTPLGQHPSDYANDYL